MPQSHTAQMRPADFGSRFTAFVLDATLLFVVQWLVVVVVSRLLQAAGMVSVEPCGLGSPISCEGPNAALWTLLAVIVVVSTFGYHAWFDGVVGATPGKRVAGLRVVATTEDGEGTSHGDTEPIGPGFGLVRAVFRQLPWLFVFFFVAGSPVAVDLPEVVWFGLLGVVVLIYVVGALHPEGTALHDIVASSRVVVAATSTTVAPVLDSPAVDIAPKRVAAPSDGPAVDVVPNRVAAPSDAPGSTTPNRPGPKRSTASESNQSDPDDGSDDRSKEIEA